MSSEGFSKASWAEIPPFARLPLPEGYEHPWGEWNPYDAKLYDDALATREMSMVVCHILPGQASQHHRHVEAEEIHVLLSGGGQIRIGDVVHDAKPLDAFRVDAKVDRSLHKHTDEEAWWLVIGAPLSEFQSH